MSGAIEIVKKNTAAKADDPFFPDSFKKEAVRRITLFVNRVVIVVVVNIRRCCGWHPPLNAQCSIQKSLAFSDAATAFDSRFTMFHSFQQTCKITRFVRLPNIPNTTRFLLLSQTGRSIVSRSQVSRCSVRASLVACILRCSPLEMTSLRTCSVPSNFSAMGHLLRTR